MSDKSGDKYGEICHNLMDNVENNVGEQCQMIAGRFFSSSQNSVLPLGYLAECLDLQSSSLGLRSASLISGSSDLDLLAIFALERFSDFVACAIFLSSAKKAIFYLDSRFLNPPFNLIRVTSSSIQFCCFFKVWPMIERVQLIGSDGVNRLRR